MTLPCIQRVKDRAMLLLAMREHGLIELKRKLTQKLPDCLDVIDTVLAELETSGWLSEIRFVEASIRKAVSSGHGPIRLKLTLKQHGIDANLVNELLQLADIDWLSVAKKVREKKFGDALPKDRQQTAQQIRFLSYRGFDGDMIRQVLNDADMNA
jgi:regulatory protein